MENERTANAEEWNHRTTNGAKFLNDFNVTELKVYTSFVKAICTDEFGDKELNFDKAWWKAPYIPPMG